MSGRLRKHGRKHVFAILTTYSETRHCILCKVPEEILVVTLYTHFYRVREEGCSSKAINNMVYV